jgi:hypothetical protein
LFRYAALRTGQVSTLTTLLYFSYDRRNQCEFLIDCIGEDPEQHLFAL